MRMHLKAKKELLRKKNEEKEARRAEKAANIEELKQKVEEAKDKKEKKASGELKEPPFMDTLMNFLGGVKLSLIHI